jgi:hypothetical protein
VQPSELQAGSLCADTRVEGALLSNVPVIFKSIICADDVPAANEYRAQASNRFLETFVIRVYCLALTLSSGLMVKTLSHRRWPDWGGGESLAALKGGLGRL